VGRHSAPRRQAAPPVVSPSPRPATHRADKHPLISRKAAAAAAGAAVLVVTWTGVEGVRALERPAGDAAVDAAGLSAAGALHGAGAAAGSADGTDNRVSRDKRATRAPGPSASAGSSPTGSGQPTPAPTSNTAQLNARVAAAWAAAATLPPAATPPPADPDKTVPGAWVRPSVGVMSSCFCERWGEMHEGIDLAGPMNAPILAVGDGVVIDAGPAEGFGLWVVIQHRNGDVSVYGHMYRYYVTVGQHVTAGQHIADIGANGESTGPHLHFGVRQGSADGPYIDPVPWLKARGIDVGPYDPNA